MINFRYNTNTSWYDLLFNMLLGFIVMFVIVLSMIATKLQSLEKVPELKGEFIVTMTWQESSKDDVDLWIEDPNGNIVSFLLKTNGFMTLERDDYGQRGDEDDQGNLLYKENRELVIIRKSISGEYTVNAHLYSKQCEEPADITIRLEKITPYSNVITKTLQLQARGDELTAFRFFVDDAGNIISTNDNPKSIIGGK